MMQAYLLRHPHLCKNGIKYRGQLWKIYLRNSIPYVQTQRHIKDIGYLQRKRKVYYYEDVELTDKLLVEYIDTEAFTIYELEKIVGAIFVQRSKYKHKNVKMIKNKLCNII